MLQRKIKQGKTRRLTGVERGAFLDTVAGEDTSKEGTSEERSN